MQKYEILRLGELDYHTNEAFNTLCTNLSLAGGDIRKILITSCQAGEGKSFVSINLMRAFAELGMRVVLVDADLRASMLMGDYEIHSVEQRSRERVGLTNYLAGRCSVEAILGSTNIENAYLIPAGKTVMKSLAFLRSSRLQDMLDQLAERFDVVLVDAPPVGLIIDAVRIAELCDGTLLVIESGSVSAREIRDVEQQIEKTGCPILGMVLNKYDELRYGGRYYSNRYYDRYQQAEKNTKRTRSYKKTNK